MMKTLRIVSVALLLALILAACSVIAPESSATVLYEGEPVAVPFKLGSTATETELKLVNTGEMQFQFAVSVSDNTNNWLQATTTQGWRTLGPEEEYPIILSHTCDTPGRYQAVVVVEYSHVGRPNTTMRVPVVLDCAAPPPVPPAPEVQEGIEVRFDGVRLLDGNTIPLQAGQSGSAISVHNIGETKARVEVSLPESPTWLRLNQTVHGPTELAGSESYTVPLEYACAIGGTDPTTALVTVDGNTHLEVVVTLSGCDVPAASLAFEIAGTRVTQASFTPAMSSQTIEVVNTSTTTPLQITSTFDDDNGVFAVDGTGTTTLTPGATQSLLVVAQCVAGSPDGAGFIHVEYDAAQPNISLPLSLTGCIEPENRIEISRAGGGVVGGTLDFDSQAGSSEKITFTNISEQQSVFSVTTDNSDWFTFDGANGSIFTLVAGESREFTAGFSCPASGVIDPDEIFINFDSASRSIPVSLRNCSAPEPAKPGVSVRTGGAALSEGNTVIFLPGAQTPTSFEVRNSGNIDLVLTVDIDQPWLTRSGNVTGSLAVAVGDSVVIPLIAQCPSGPALDATVALVHGTETLFEFTAVLTGCIEPEARLEVRKDGADLTSNALQVTATNGGPESTALTLKNVSLQDVQFEINSTSPEGWMWVSAVPGATYTLQPGEQQPLNVFYQCQVEAPTVSEITISIVGAAASRTIEVDLAGCATKPLIATTLDSVPIDDPANVSLNSIQTRAVLKLENPSTTTPLEFSGAITSGNSWLHIPNLPGTASLLLPGASFTLPVLYTCPATGNHSAQLQFTNGPQLTFNVDCVVNNDPLYVSLQAGSVLHVLPLEAQQGKGTVELTIYNPSRLDAQVEYAIRGATGDWLAFEQPTDGTTTFTVASSGTHTVSLAYECKVGNLPTAYDSAEFVVKNNGVEEVIIPAFLLGCLDNPAEQVKLYIDDIEATEIRLAGQAPSNPLFVVENTGGEQITFTLDIIESSVSDWIEVAEPYAGRITAQPGQKVPFTLVWDCTAPQPARSAKLTVNIIGGVVHEFPITASACQ